MKTKLSLKSFIKKEKFYYVNSKLTDLNFPSPKTVKEPTDDNCKLIHIARTMTSQEVLESIKKEGYRPANAHELMLWFSKNKSSIKPYEWIVALQQTWKDADGHHGVPSVDAYSGGGFEFSLGLFEFSWSDGFAFLCFCDKKPSEPQTLKELESLDSSELDSLKIRVATLEGAMCILKKAFDSMEEFKS